MDTLPTTLSRFVDPRLVVATSPDDGLFRRLRLSLPLVRLLAAGAVLLLVPALLSLGALFQAGTIEVGEPAPRTVITDDTITVVNEETTLEQRRQAAAAVEARTAQDPEARAQIVDRTREIFTVAASVRTSVAPTPATSSGPGDVQTSPARPSPEEQQAALQAAFPDMAASLVEGLVALPDDELPEVRSEAVSLAQLFAREDVMQENLDVEVEQFLARELPLLGSQEIAQGVIGPVLEYVALPTIRVDVDATDAARQEAFDSVEDVATEFQPGDTIVAEGQTVDDAAFQALQQAGLEASSGPLRYLRALGAMAVVVTVLGLYLWRMQPRVWQAARKLVLLAAVVVGYAGVVTGVSLFSEAGQVAWWYLVPVGAFAMLLALLIHPVVAIASMLPAVVMVTLAAPLSNGVAVFTAAAVLTCVPLTIGLASRGDLRSATLRAGVAMPVIAALAIAVFGPHAEFWPAVGAAALNGLLITLLVQGLLPFLETTFRLPTVTGLLDLADRNHPLMRELEAKAIGSYNHSVMVASLTERACRHIGADPLLGSVAALYHDIGKVRRPHFFIENQYGISNPHDELEPQVSALIIQEHVVDGVRMATEHRLPPEVVAAIGSHHGTMLVSYFYNKAVRAADGDASRVDEAAFRYHGQKPRAKEAAVLLIADCSEAATRAMAMDRGTLPRGVIEATVDSLMETRIEDGQFDECDLTFDELRRVRDSVVEALEGIYHPRIAYPGGDSGQRDDRRATAPAQAPQPDDATSPDDGVDSDDEVVADRTRQAGEATRRVTAVPRPRPRDGTTHDDVSLPWAADVVADSEDGGDAEDPGNPGGPTGGRDGPDGQPDDRDGVAGRHHDSARGQSTGHHRDPHGSLDPERALTARLAHLDDIVVPEITARRP